MTDRDKANNKGEELRGKVKEGAGRATNDPELERQGQRDQSKADVKQAGEKVKDSIKDLGGKKDR
ncbi:MAG: CsbD family protein [Actinomycetota bacterium]|nr:CsbD family protein [Actinomycetota bacterium]